MRQCVSQNVEVPRTGRPARRRRPGIMETGLHMVSWAVVRGYLRACHGVRVHHRQNIPAEPPFVLVSNHTSHLDALVLASSLRYSLTDRVYPIAAGDVFFESRAKRFFSVALINALPMWRKNCGSHALTQLRHRLLEGTSAYIFFPEGGRSRDGALRSFKAGIGMLVAGTSVPVVPCWLDGCFEAMPPNTRWPRSVRITVRVGEPQVFAATPNDRLGWDHVAISLESAVRRLAAEAASNGNRNGGRDGERLETTS